MRKPPRLTTLHPKLATAPQRIASPAGDDKRKRGRAGMKDRERIRLRDEGLCQACLDRNVVTLGTQVDHVIPLHQGGPDTDANKRLLCEECHAEKTREDYNSGGVG